MTDLKAAAEAAKTAEDIYRTTGAPEDSEQSIRARYAMFDACTHEALLALYAERDEARKSATRAENALKLHAGDCMSLETEINDLRLHHDADMKAAEAAIAPYKEEVERLRAAMRETSEYLRKLEDNMLANDADMMLDDCLPPSFHADQIDQALTKEPPHAG